MKAVVHIREATPSDLPALHALASAALEHDSFSVNLLAQKLFFNPHPRRDVYSTLVAEHEGRLVGLLQYVIDRQAGKAWLGIFAVEAAVRRRGIGRKLYDLAVLAWLGQGVRVVDVLTLPTNYLVPGIDRRYEPACCFVESLGFVRRAEKVNMLAILDRDFDTCRQEAELARLGFVIRRAVHEDAALIEQFFAKCFGEGWLAEVRLAMQQHPPAVHLALVGDEVVAFAAHSTMNQEWGNFGPMGTAEQARDLGLGEILLYRCMADLKLAGHKTAVIPWVGPDSFYSRLLNCRIDRVFHQYRLEYF